MARDRYEDEDDDDDRGRGRGRDDDYDDDDDDDRPRRRKKLSGMDSFFNNIAVAILLAIFFLFCCWPVGIILGGIGAGTCSNPDSKRNAIIVLVSSIAGGALNLALYFTGAMANAFK